MTRVAVIGAGQTGASAALGLAKRGVEVTVYSDRSQDSLKNDVPATGTAIIFKEAQQAERRLGLRTYLDVAPPFTGMSGTVVSEPNVELIAYDATFDGFRAEGVDTRLKADDRINAFRSLGGAFVVRRVDDEAIDDIAAENDLTLVATGKLGLSSIFPRDESRSFFQAPQRRLLMLTATGLGHDESVFAHHSPAGGAHAVFSFIGEKGEAWWGPYYHKDAGPSWSFLGWAKPGSEWEAKFAAATSAESALRIVVDLHRDYLPWDFPEISQLKIIADDPHSWLGGSVTPTVRSGIGRTKSRRPVAALGDAAITFDPIAAQGAQSGLIQAAIYVEKIVAHDGPFDETWIRNAHDTFYAQRGGGAELVTRLFLGYPDLADIAQVFIAAANGSPRFAAELFGLISDPRPLLSVRSINDAKALITWLSGEKADVVLERSQQRIALAQEKNKGGLNYFARSNYVNTLGRTAA
jgi:Styrene monooxygenase A putative substrate binding domain